MIDAPKKIASRRPSEPARQTPVDRRLAEHPFFLAKLKYKQDRAMADIGPVLSKYFDWFLSHSDEIAAAGLEPGDIAKSLDADVDAICKVSKHCCDLVRRRAKLKRQGQTQVVSRKIAVSDALVNRLSMRDIAARTGISKSAISRRLSGGEP